MKKIIVIFSALGALSACTKQPNQETPTVKIDSGNSTGFIHYAWDNNPHFVPKKISHAYLNFRVTWFKNHPHTKDSLDKIVKLAEENLNEEETGKIKSRVFTEF